MHVIEWVTKTVNRDGKNLRHLKSQKLFLFQSFFLYFLAFTWSLWVQHSANYVPLTHETKLICPGRFFHWKIKVVREWPNSDTEYKISMTDTISNRQICIGSCYCHSSHISRWTVVRPNFFKGLKWAAMYWIVRPSVRPPVSPHVRP